MSAAAVLNQDDSRRSLGMRGYAKNGQAQRAFLSDTLSGSFTFQVLLYLILLFFHPEKQKKQESCQYFGRWKWGTETNPRHIDHLWLIAPLSSLVQGSQVHTRQHQSRKTSPGMRQGHHALPCLVLKNELLCLPRREKIGHFSRQGPVKSQLPNQATFNRSPELDLRKVSESPKIICKSMKTCACVRVCVCVWIHEDNFYQIIYLHDL